MVLLKMLVGRLGEIWKMKMITLFSYTYAQQRVQWICASRRLVKIKVLVAQTTNAIRWLFAPRLKTR